jgi:hypothetical protein
MAATPGNQEAQSPMKSRVFTITSLLALMIALCAASVASAQTQNITPGGDVYVKDFVQGDGNTNVRDTEETCKSRGGVDENGNSCDDVVADCDNGATVDAVTGQPCTTATVSEGDLPFTGFEAGIVALAGLALLGAGFGMRRMTRSQGAA